MYNTDGMWNNITSFSDDYFPYLNIDVRNQVYDTFDLRRFCSNILVDIPNHDEEEWEEEEEAAGLEVLFIALELDGQQVEERIGYVRMV